MSPTKLERNRKIDIESLSLTTPFRHPDVQEYQDDIHIARTLKTLLTAYQEQSEQDKRSLKVELPYKRVNYTFHLSQAQAEKFVGMLIEDIHERMLEISNVTDRAYLHSFRNPEDDDSVTQTDTIPFADD